MILAFMEKMSIWSDTAPTLFFLQLINASVAEVVNSGSGCTIRFTGHLYAARDSESLPGAESRYNGLFMISAFSK